MLLGYIPRLFRERNLVFFTVSPLHSHCSCVCIICSNLVHRHNRCSSLSKMHTSLRSALYGSENNRSSRQEETISELEEYLKQGQNPNARDGSATSLLELCIDFKTIHISMDYRFRVANLLLSYRADPNSTYRDGWTAVHWCAKADDIELLKLIVSKGGRVNVKTKQSELPVDIAAKGWKQEVMVYCDKQSANLKQMARAAILSHLGHRARATAWKLPLPPKLRLFLNYGNPYPGYELVPIPEALWTNEELQQNKPSKKELLKFLVANADEEFLADYKLPSTADVIDDGSQHSYHDLISALQSLYLYECFKPISYEEPPAREPRFGKDWAATQRYIDGLYSGNMPSQ